MDSPTGVWTRTEEEARFKIVDLARFSEVIRTAEPTILGEPTVRPVRYIAKQGDPFDGPIRRGPFDKSVGLQFECEIRAMWLTTWKIAIGG